jgi:ComF family protein
MSLLSLATLPVAWALEIVAPTRCAACDELVGPRGLFCPACAATLLTPSELGARAPEALWAYGGAAASAITRLKYGPRPDLGPRLGRALAAFASQTIGTRPDLVVPVPLHPRRLVERGANQAALLAAPVARALGAVYLPGALVRVRDTPRQAARGRAGRLANVEGAFVAASPRQLDGKTVVLVDDVRTTGATLEACAKALRSAQARHVTTLVLAVALGP